MQTFKPVSLAIIGCGVITKTRHLPTALRSPLVDVVALIDARVETADALARSFGLSCPVGPTLDAVSCHVDGVVIATPNHTHAAVAAAALERGIPTLIEKPFTTTSADAEMLCALAERHGTFISVGYRSRHWPSVKLFKRLYDEGYFGAARSFHYEVGIDGGYSPDSGFSIDARLAGGGVLVDMHILDKILYWFGEPVAVEYADDNHGGVEANCKGRLSFGAGAEAFAGTFFLSRTANLRNAMTLLTDRYQVTVAESVAPLTIVDRQRPELKFDVTEEGPSGTLGSKTDFDVQLEEFARCIRGVGTLTVDGAAGARAVRLTERLYACRTALPEPWLNDPAPRSLTPTPALVLA